MIRYIPTALRQFVTARASNRCEYCRLAQAGQEATFHIDHILPVAAGGTTTEDNLALACVSCSLRKAARQVAPDPRTGRDVSIYHPRHQRWYDHFRWESLRVIGRTATGRATVAALEMNRATMLAIRLEQEVFGRHPPGSVPITDSPGEEE